MADAPKLLPDDKLREGYPKINKSIDNANEALNRSFQAESTSSNAVSIASSAVVTAGTAETKANSVQEQFNQVVIKGDSSVEAAQARVDLDGHAYSTLKERVDAEQNKIWYLDKKNDGVISITEYESYKIPTANGYDYAPVIQRAANDAQTKGKTHVIVPYKSTGYLIASKVDVPKGIYLVGQGNSQAGYLSGGTKGTGIFTKTYFIMDYYTGSHGAFDIKDSSGMSNFGFYYKTVDTNLATGDVPTFPFSITASGFGFELKNLSVMGASHFISINSFERSTIQGIYGLVTKIAFRIVRSRDISRITDIQFNPNMVFPAQDGKTSEGFSTYFRDLMKRDFTAFKLGSADYYYMENILTIFTNKFIHIVPNDLDDGLGVKFDNYTFTMMGNNMMSDNTKYGLYIERSIAFTAKFSNLSLVPIDNVGGTANGRGIVMTGGASGMLSISNFDSKGSPGMTDKHVVLNSTGVSVVDIHSGNFISPGNDTVRTGDYSDMFTITGNNKLRAELLFGKTNSVGVYKTVLYNSDYTQIPNGTHYKKYGIKDDNTTLSIVKRDGADVEYPLLNIDSVGGLAGGFATTVVNGNTTIYDMRGTNNLNGRGLFLVSANFAGAAYCIGFTNGSAVYPISVGGDATLNTANPGTAGKLNIFQSASGVLGIQNNLGSDRSVTVTLFSAIK